MTSFGSCKNKNNILKQPQQKILNLENKPLEASDAALA